MASPATVGEITTADIAEVADYLAGQVPAGEAVTSAPLPPEARLRWLLLDNPVKVSGIPHGWLIRNARRAVVGAAVCIPFRIIANEFACTALMFAKFYVDEEYRGMGLGLLMRFIREGNKFPLFVTSTNAIAGELFARVGAVKINGLDHTMLLPTRLKPLAEELLHRRLRRPTLSRILASPARMFPGRRSRNLRLSNCGDWNHVASVAELADANLPSSIDALAVVRDSDYLNWRYFSGERDKEVYRFRLPGERDRMVVVNRVLAGYRSQIRVLNVLDIWPPSTPQSVVALASGLARIYKKSFDVIWLRSQPAEVEQVLRKEGFRHHAFPAPLGWYIDRGKQLPTGNWYLMPGESE